MAAMTTCATAHGSCVAIGTASAFATLTGTLLAGTALSTVAVADEVARDRIVVTAERREMELQDTPISVLAYTPEVMEQQGVEDLQDLALYAPNLSIQGARGFGVNQPTFMIRGIAGGGGAISERGVALYIDGIYVPRTNGAIFDVLDMERIEVLRGPQGTLFGRNSTGGAIRMFSQRPSEEQEGYIRATLGEQERADLIGMVNIPVSDRFFLRLQGGYLSEEGWVKRGSQDLGSSEDWVGRIQAKALIGETVTANFGFLYSDAQSNGSPQDVETFDMRPGIEGVWDGNFADWLSDAFEAVGQDPIAAFNDPRIVLDDFTMPDICLLDDFDPDGDPACNLKNDSVYWQADATFEWEVNDMVSFTSITGLAEMDHEGITSWQQLGFEARPDDVNSEVFYQEFQLNAALFDGKVDFVTGLNYFSEDSSSVGGLFTRRGSSATTGPICPPPLGLPAEFCGVWATDLDQDGVVGVANGDTAAVGSFGPNGLFFTDDTRTNQESRSWGWFNSGTWHVSDWANLTLGARWARDEKDYMQTEFLSDNFVPFVGDSTTVMADDSWEEIDWRATLDISLTDDNMVYGTVSKAYRAGQFSYPISDASSGEDQSAIIRAIPPEKVVNYELGTRNEFFNNNLQLNLTGYFMEWTNRQGPVQVPCEDVGIAAEDCPVGFIIQVINSGDVDLYGAELDGQLYVTDNFRLYGNYAWTEYDLHDPVSNFGPFLFPEPPTHSGAVGGVVNQSLGANGDLDWSLNYTYVGEMETHPTDVNHFLGDSSYTQPSYGLVNGRVQWNQSDGRYSVALFANNLLDETYASYSTRFGGGFWDLGGPRRGAGAPDRTSRNVVRGQPRQVGVTVQINF